MQLLGHRGWRIAPAAFIAATIAGAGLVLSSAAPAAAAASPSRVLLAVSADAVAVFRTPDGMRVSLPSDSVVTWFTDRPARQAGVLSAGALATAWPSSFATDPPNAAVLLAGDGIERIHVVEMRSPKTSADGTRVSFRIRALPGQQVAGYAHRDPIRPGRLARGQFFIDALSDISIQGIDDALFEGWGGLIGPTDPTPPS